VTLTSTASTASDDHPWVRRLTALAVLLHLAWMLLEVFARLGAEHGGLHSEELANPWMTQMLLAGHWEHWTELRYRSFCGGCGVSSTLALPLIALFGPRVVVWKLVPLAFHACVVLCSVILARRWWGERAGALAAALWLGAPAVFLELSTLGWGNHAEVMALVLATLVVLGRGDTLLRAICAGALAGFAVWFCRTGAMVLPAAAFVFIVGRAGQRAKSAGAFGAAALSLQLLHLNGSSERYRHSEPVRISLTDLQGLLHAPVDLLAWITGPVVTAKLWPTASTGSHLPVLYGGLLLGGALLLPALAARLDLRSRRASAIPALLILGWGAGMVLGHTAWTGIVAASSTGPFYLRYLTPAVVCLLLATAAGAGAGVPVSLRRAVWVLPLLGVGLRLASAEPPRFDLAAQPLPSTMGRAPDVQNQPLADLERLLASRSDEPRMLRTGYIERAVERFFQDHLDTLEAAATEAGVSPSVTRELRLGVESRQPPSALEELDEEAGRPPLSPEFVSFLASLDHRWERRAAMRRLLPVTLGPEHQRFGAEMLSGWLGRTHAQLDRAGQLSLEHAIGEAAATVLATRPDPDSELRPGLALDSLPEELRPGACFAMGVRLGEWAVLHDPDRRSLGDLTGMGPDGCDAAELRDGIARGAWRIGGYRARPDLAAAAP
jgi:hypothetical protein